MTMIATAASTVPTPLAPTSHRCTGSSTSGIDLRALIRFADAASELAGRLAAWLALALVALESGLVAVRYLFNAGSIAAQEAVLWLHGGLFLLALCYALKHGAHVRVDVFSQRWSERTRARVECAGIALLLLPVCMFMLWVSFDYVAVSWAQHEGSNSDGLPGWYLIKSLIPLSAALLLLQAVAEGLRAWARAQGAEEVVDGVAMDAAPANDAAHSKDGPA